jgi:hypothetical protein
MPNGNLKFYDCDSFHLRENEPKKTLQLSTKRVDSPLYYGLVMLGALQLIFFLSTDKAPPAWEFSKNRLLFLECKLP